MERQDSNYEPISCSNYDVIEVICMHRYQVALTLNDGTITGKALDLEVRSPDEFLVLQRDDGVTDKIRLDRIQRLEVLTRPSQFSNYDFKS